MLFGDKRSFAVEFELNDDYGGSWLFGKFCYWVHGVQVGDFLLGTSLRDVLFQLKYPISDCGNRYDEQLCCSNGKELFDYIDSRLYGENNLISPFQTEVEIPARFNVTLQVDIFDQWKIFIIDCKDKTKIVFRNTLDNDVSEFWISNGEFDRAIKAAYSELNRLYDLELDKDVS